MLKQPLSLDLLRWVAKNFIRRPYFVVVLPQQKNIVWSWQLGYPVALRTRAQMAKGRLLCENHGGGGGACSALFHHWLISHSFRPTSAFVLCRKNVYCHRAKGHHNIYLPSWNGVTA